MRPTEGGRIGESLSAAGSQLASDLSQIKGAQQIEAKRNAQAKITAKTGKRSPKHFREKRYI